jgi:hypothetical protein
MDIYDPDFNEFARLLAGLDPAGRMDPFADDRVSPAWQHHARALETLFARFESEFALPFSDWAQSHLGEFRKLDTVFYPFSGPDFMFAHLLHPTAGTILLGGLEACEAPGKGRMDSLWEPRMELLGELASGIRHFLEHAFFITAEMRDTFGPKRWNGILAPLLVFLARTGHDIKEVVHVPLPGAPVSSGNPTARVMRIRAQLGGKARQVFYIEKHLRDDHCPASDPFFKFAGSFGRLGVFLKSASYLLHEPDFSHLREFIFARAACLVQDPSSIPYAALLEHGWRVRVHGQYQRSPRAFPQYEQPGLIEACQSAGAAATSLPFGFGYHSQPGMASLMIASPRPPTTASPVRARTSLVASGLSPCWETADPS